MDEKHQQPTLYEMIGRANNEVPLFGLIFSSLLVADDAAPDRQRTHASFNMERRQV